MSLETQKAILRFLQNKEITRIGGKVPKPVDVRIISATNINLMEAIANKQFRSDLYYRLNVININIPPLRERTRDIVPLFRHFARLYGVRSIPSAATPSMPWSPIPGRAGKIYKKGRAGKLILIKFPSPDQIKTQFWLRGSYQAHFPALPGLLIMRKCPWFFRCPVPTGWWYWS